MEIEKSRIGGYRIEWGIEPSLWEDDETESYILNIDDLRIEIKNKTVSVLGTNQDDFRNRASRAMEAVSILFILNRGGGAMIVRERRNELICSGSSRFLYCFEDTKRFIDNNSKLLKYYMDDTLRSSVAYYNLALQGSDQLAIAGNLYMAMEELAAKFKCWDEVSDALKPFDKKITKNHVTRKIRQKLNEGRHAYLNDGSKAQKLDDEELNRQKQWIREVILAYVEWLKQNP